MKFSNIIPANFKINFVGKRKIFFFIAIVITITAIVALFIRGLNYGLDFRGGTTLDIKIIDKQLTISGIRQKLSDAEVEGASIQTIDSDDNILIKIPSNDKALGIIKNVLKDQVEYRSTEQVGPRIGEEMMYNAIKAIIAALIAILIYIWVRFEWYFAVCGVVTLLHDCIALLGFFAVYHTLEFSSNAIVAILVTASYSIHGTVIVFDRIRERMKHTLAINTTDTVSFSEIVNASMNETLSRNILTTTTVLISLVSLFVFGGQIIAAFSLPLIIGICFGGFSSICLAVPLVLSIAPKDILQKQKQKTTTNNSP